MAPTSLRYPLALSSQERHRGKCDSPIDKIPTTIDTVSYTYGNCNLLSYILFRDFSKKIPGTALSCNAKPHMIAAVFCRYSQITVIAASEVFNYSLDSFGFYF